MIKSELIQRLSKATPDLHANHLEVIVNAILEEITIALSRGDRIELRDFGIFSVKQHAARIGRNPKTGQIIQIDAKRSLQFKAGKSTREKLNPRGQ